MKSYRIKTGKHYKNGNRYLPGDIVELTDREAGPLMFKLDLIEPEPEPAFDLQDATINQIKEAMSNNLVSANEVMKHEMKQEKPRVSLLDWLEDVEDGP